MAAARELVEGVSMLRQQVGAGVDVAVGLAVAASLTVAEYLMPELLIRLRRAEPRIAVQLRVANSQQVIALVRDDEVPVGFVEGTRVPSDLTSAVVGTDRLVLVVVPSHDWARRRRLPIAELLETPLLLREPGSGTRETLESRLARYGPLAPPALQLSTSTSIRTAALAGGAPAVLSELTVRADLARGRLVEVAMDGPALHLDLKAVWQRGRPLTGAALTLLVLAREHRRRRSPQ